MICSVAVSLKRRCSPKWNRKPSASSHTRWYLLLPNQLMFLSVCAVANLLRRAAWESSRLRDLHSAKELRSQLWLQPYSSGKVHTTPRLHHLASKELHKAPCSLSCYAKALGLNAKAVISVDDGSCLANGQSRPPKDCSAKARFPRAATPFHGSSIISW